MMYFNSRQARNAEIRNTIATTSITLNSAVSASVSMSQPPLSETSLCVRGAVLARQRLRLLKVDRLRAELAELIDARFVPVDDLGQIVAKRGVEAVAAVLVEAVEERA